ncbi:MAG: patatin-like phospholipase family protein [Pseudomonadota bacterium]
MRVISVIMSLLALAACSSPPDDLTCPVLNVVSPEGIEVSQGRVMTPEEAQVFGMGAMFDQRAEAASDAPASRALPRIKVALLSSGGQFGAHTAGFMNGWSQNTTDPRPQEFDVVTGVSTGALIAPFVFAGSGYDSDLEKLYNGVQERDVLRRRNALELLGAPSLWDAQPLARQVDQNLTGPLWAEIANAEASRTLLAGTVNVNTGFFEAFDLTEVAAKGGANARDCMREGLLASAAIPVAFPPRRINGNYYIDGAARQGLFLRGLAAARVEPEIYVFLNNPATFPADSPSYALPTLAGRSTEILSDELLRSSAEDAVRFARARGWTVRGVFAPDLRPGPDCENRDGGKSAFCASFTRALFAAGQSTARMSPIPWLDADALMDKLAESRRTQRRN